MAPALRSAIATRRAMSLMTESMVPRSSRLGQPGRNGQTRRQPAATGVGPCAAVGDHVQRLRCGGLPALHPDLSIRAQKGPCVGVLKGLAFGMLKRLLRTAATGTV